MKKICLPNEQTRVASEYLREEEKCVWSIKQAKQRHQSCSVVTFIDSIVMVKKS